MKQVKQICEFGRIWNKTDFDKVPNDSFDCIYLDESSFLDLWNFVAENNNPEAMLTSFFHYIVRKVKISSGEKTMWV